MTLGRDAQVLVAVVDHAHGPVRSPREQRRVAREHRRIILLAAESAAGRRLHDARPHRIDAEHARQRLLHVVRTLHRALHEGDAARVGGERDDALGLDVHLLLRICAVRAFDHALRSREHAERVALVDRDLLEDARARLHVEHGLELVDARRDRGERGFESLAVRRGDEQQRLAEVLDLSRAQERLIVDDHRDQVLARHVVGTGDHDSREVERARVIEAEQAPARDVRAHCAAEPSSADAQVRDVERATRDLVAPLRTSQHASDVARHAQSLVPAPERARPVFEHPGRGEPAGQRCTDG